MGGGAVFVMSGFYRGRMDFVVTLTAKGGNVERFVITAADEIAVREQLVRDQGRYGISNYLGLDGVPVYLVWRNVAFPEPHIAPVPCT